jgi:hypothetical protein
MKSIDFYSCADKPLLFKLYLISLPVLCWVHCSAALLIGVMIFCAYLMYLVTSQVAQGTSFSQIVSPAEESAEIMNVVN